VSRRLRIEWSPGRKVTGWLEWPVDPRSHGVLLAHGAGAPSSSPFMVRMRKGLAAADYPVLAFDYPYLDEGRRAPDRPAVLETAHLAAAARLATYVDRSAFAGKSMGGRVGSHVAVAGGAVALVFYGYPLVAMGKEEPRPTGHLDAAALPMLFITGERDRMAPLHLLRPVVAALPHATLEIVPDGDHSLKVPKRTGRSHEQVIDAVVRRTVEWLDAVDQGMERAAR
jgi:predicted alpha/beta-hydrolase family hydrolase